MTITVNAQAQRCWVLWKDAAISITNSAGVHYPLEYAGRVARLGMGTWAQESKFRHERQLGFSTNPDVNDRGAWGLGQCERGSITESVILSRQNPKLLVSINGFLGRYHEPALDSWFGRIPDLLRYLATPGPTGDATACVLTRLHYLYRSTTGIPGNLVAQAAYYKWLYNTEGGKATIEEYLGNWRTLCQPVLDLDRDQMTVWAA